MWGWGITAVLVLIAGIALRQYSAARGMYRPLSSRQPTPRTDGEVPLGMEALNMDDVRRTQRRNESLERSHTNWTRDRRQGYTDAADTDVPHLGDDETYAARYHRAFHKPKD